MTTARWLVSAALMVGAGTGGVSTAGEAQEVPRPAVTDTVASVDEIVRSGLDDVAAAFEWAWREAHVDRIRDHLAPPPQRIRIQLGPSQHTGLTRRQAAAALGNVLEARRAGHSELEQVIVAGGTPERGFAEVVWSSVPAGTSQRVTYTVYVGFLRMEEEWRVTEIRVLR